MAEMAEIDSLYVKFGAKVDAFLQGAATVSKHLGGMEAKFATAGAKMTKYITLPALAIGGLSVKAAIDFESAFTGVIKTVDATSAELAELKQGIRDMAKELPASATEIAGVAEAAGQLGIQTDAILSFTRTMIDLGETTNLSAEDAATALARFANIVQMPQSQFDRLGSTVVALGNNLATTEREIVEMGLRLAGAGKQVGMTEAQILSFAGALSSVGIEAQAGGSAFSKVMVQMQLATEKGGAQLNNFAKVAGMSAQEFAQAFQRDATGAIIAFIRGLETAGERGVSAIKVLDDMGITEVRMRDALLRAAGAGDLFAQSIAIGTQAWAENVALTNEANLRYDTTESKLKVMKNRITDAGISLGEKLIPVVESAIPLIEKIAGAVGKVVDWFSRLSDTQQGVVAALTAIMVTAGPIMSAFNLIKSGLHMLAGAFQFFHAHPAVIGFAAIAATCYGVYRAVDETVNGSIRAFETMVQAIDELEKAWGDLTRTERENTIAQMENNLAMLEAAKAAGFSKAAGQIQTLQETIDRYTNSLDKNVQATNDFVAAVMRVNEEGGGITQTVQDMGQSMQRAGRDMATGANTLSTEVIGGLKSSKAGIVKISEDVVQGFFAGWAGSWAANITDIEGQAKQLADVLKRPDIFEPSGKQALMTWMQAAQKEFQITDVAMAALATKLGLNLSDASIFDASGREAAQRWTDAASADLSSDASVVAGASSQGQKAASAFAAQGSSAGSAFLSRVQAVFAGRPAVLNAVIRVTDAVKRSLGALGISVPGLAAGGIVTRPTLAMIGEGPYPEAVVPLDGRHLNKTINIEQHNTISSHMDLFEVNRLMADAVAGA